MVKLRPCPFCGNERLSIEELRTEEMDEFGKNISYRFGVVCLACGASGGKFGATQEKLKEKVIQNAIGAWNRRVLL